MRFRRTSDSVAYACIWWFTFLLFNAGLVYYACIKIRDVLSRDFFLQTNERPRSVFEGKMSFPDIMMCTTETNYKISGIEDIEGREMVVRKNIAINETSLPMDRDLCAPHPWLTIFSTEKVDVNLSKSSVFKLQLIPQANASADWLAWIYLVPSHDNPFLSRKNVTRDVWSGSYDKHFTASLNNTLINVQFMNVQTHTLRTDFWGYFGALNETTVRSVETESSSTFINGKTTIQIFLPKKEMEHTQILVTSIPSAFASWGGWFSVVWGVFYILFGSPRLDPFGLVALCFMTNKAKRKILKAYGPLPQQPPSTHGPDADPSRRMSNVSNISVSSFATDPIMHDQMSPIAPGDYSKMAIQNIPHQTQRMVDQRFRRLERMLSEFYLNMPTDDLQEEEEGGKRGWFWRRGRRGVSPAETGKSGDEYYGVDLRGNDPYHDQIPLRGYDPRTMAREE